MGDVLLATPVFQALKESYPGCWVGALVRPATVSLLQPHPFVDEVIADDPTGAHEGWKGFWRLAGEIRSKHADVGLVLWPTRRNMKALYWGGVSNILSFGRRPFQWMWGDGIFRRRLGHLRRHEVENNLEVAGLVGASAFRPLMTISLTEEDQKFSYNFYAHHRVKVAEKVVGLFPGHGGSAVLKVPLSTYVQVAVELRQAGLKVMVGVGPSERAETEAWHRAFGQSATLWSDPDWSLGRLAAAISRWNVFVGMSTGPMHLASALGVPVVSLFTPIDGNTPRRWGPWGVPSIILTPGLPILCPDCFGNRCPYYNCMSRIPVAEIVQAVGQILSRSHGDYPHRGTK